MKLSINWLREFVDLKDISDASISEAITIHTAEVEEIIDQEAYFQSVFWGQLKQIASHPKSSKLKIGTFDCGGQGSKKIVYATLHEVAVGEILPLALGSTKLASGKIVRETEIQGEKSEGMICDNPELGFKMDGLWKTLDVQWIGKSLPQTITNLRDKRIDVDNKSLTHRPDLLGHRGFALELASIFDCNLTLPEPAVAVPENLSEGFNIQVKTPNCHRFCAIKLENIQVKPSKFETQVLLENLGIRSISNFVDITNEMMMSFGYPMHVFDADKVEGNILVRQAQPGEKIIALDNIEYTLTTEDIVVADEKKVLSIAGVMGGLDSGVTNKTRNIIFECANFEAVSIRKTSQRLGLRSDSSMRFEKSLDPAQCKKVLFSAVEKLLEGSPEVQFGSPLRDYWSQIPKLKIIILNPEKVRQYSGLKISDAVIQAKLESIHFEVQTLQNEQNQTAFQVTVPTNRATKDITIAEDLIEEVVRLYGFTNIESKLPALPIEPAPENFLRKMEWRMKDFFAHQGFLEIYGYDFVNENDRNFTGDTQYVSVANPLSLENSHLRTTLVSGAVKLVHKELRESGTLDFFEFGKVYKDRGPTSLPEEKLNFLLLSAQLKGDETESFFELKKTLESLFFDLKIVEKVSFRPIKNESLSLYIHPTKSALICYNDEILGIIGAIHPQYLESKGSFIVFAELSAEKIFGIQRNIDTKYQKISPYPTVYRDLSIVLNAKILVGDIEKLMKRQTEDLRLITLFDEYQDPIKLGENLKNLAFHLTFQSSSRTLEEGQANHYFDQIVSVLKKEFGAELRLDFDEKKAQ